MMKITGLSHIFKGRTCTIGGTKYFFAPLYILFIALHPKRFTIISGGGGGGVSSTTTSVQHPLG